MGSDLFKFKFSKSKNLDALNSRAERNSNAAPVLSDETFVKLRDLIYEKSGIYYTQTKKYLLEGRIAKRLAATKLTAFEEYVDYLNSYQSRMEMNELFEVITINETYFFRAPQQFEAFEKVITPEIIERRKSINPVLKVWSAASSTGEEAYTTAIIALEKLIPQYPNLQVQILASDINRAVLERARKGVFKEYAVRNVPGHLLAKYFRHEGGEYYLDDKVKRMVKFVNINLYDSAVMRTVTNCDVIFCCNVLIYFDLPSKQKVVSNLFNSLNKGGYLFIGYSESLHGVSKAFKLIHLPKAMAYKKE